MKRYGIFVVYDKEGIVGEYVKYLLDNLVPQLEKLVIVVNGKINSEELKKYTSDIFCRPNYGFDAGAYKDCFLDFLKDENWNEYDELILFNDTFYGPLYSWTNLIETMESYDVDFWGLSHNVGDVNKKIGGVQLLPHLQSYFIAIHKKMFLAKEFMDFWTELECSDNLNRTIANFEIGFSNFFVQRGYVYMAWTQVMAQKYGAEIHSFSNNVAELVSMYEFPILKRKMFSIKYYKEIKEAFKYVNKELSYPTDLIEKDVILRRGRGISGEYNSKKLLNFCCAHKNCYLYGKGKVAENIRYYLEHNGINISGYILSRVDEPAPNIYNILDYKMEVGDGIIVAMGVYNYLEIKELLKAKCQDEHVYIPEYY